MRSSMLFSVQIVLVLLLSSSISSAQEFDPYRRLTDPRAICRFDGPDTLPVKAFTGVGWGKTQDPYDYYYIIASGTGSGILTHLWLQFYNLQNDSDLTVRLWIDDSLVITSYLYDLFKKPHGALKAPFDSLASGGLVCDVQMPYRRNYRVTFSADYHRTCCLFWAVEYRPIVDSSIINSFRLNPDSQYKKQQKAAEDEYWSYRSPWQEDTQQFIDLPTDPIQPFEARTIATITGPSMIQTIKLHCNVTQEPSLKKMRLKMFWDNSPTPSVDVPLLDFFGCGAGFRNMNARNLQSTEAGDFTCYLPMPFAVHGRIEIVNTSEQPIGISGQVRYSIEPIDRINQGYFVAQFNETPETRWHIYHQVGSILGRGKYIGMQIALPESPSPAFLEGDPFMYIDSDYYATIRYTGFEDYVNGGWFFADSTFSHPFAGCTGRWTSLYRFHYFDAYDFQSSFHFELEHGVENDFRTNYRTVAFFYKRWTPFWTSRDTIRPTEQWNISGSGYKAKEPLEIKLGSILLDAIQADEHGEFQYHKEIPASIETGVYQLSINEERKPEAIYCFESPVIRLVHDSIPHIFRYKDSVMLYCSGFEVGDTISIFFDTTEAKYIAPTRVVNSNYALPIAIRVPWVPSGSYHIIARSNRGTMVSTETRVEITRILNYECEDLPEAYVEGYPDQRVYLGYFGSLWSNKYTHQLWPAQDGQRIALTFNVPVSDSFALSFYNTVSSNYGNYDIYIDGEFSAHFYGYKDTGNILVRSGLIDGGVKYLTAGNHQILYYCTGKDPKSDWYVLNADNIILIPTTAFHPIPPDTADSQVNSKHPMFQANKLECFPNPLTKGTLSVKINLGEDFSLGSDHLYLDLYNSLGVRVATLFDGISNVNKFSFSHDCSGLSNGAYYLRMNTIGKGGSTIKTVPLRIEMN